MPGSRAWHTHSPMAHALLQNPNPHPRRAWFFFTGAVVPPPCGPCQLAGGTGRKVFLRQRRCRKLPRTTGWELALTHIAHQRGRLRFKRPRDGPNAPHASPSGSLSISIQSELSRSSPLLKNVVPSCTRAVRGVPKRHSVAHTADAKPM